MTIKRPKNHNKRKVKINRFINIKGEVSMEDETKKEGYRFKEFSKPKVSIKDHCIKIKCFIYTDRVKNAMLLAALTGQAGVWDFAKCYRSCPNVLDKYEQNQRNYRRANSQKAKKYQKNYREMKNKEKLVAVT